MKRPTRRAVDLILDSGAFSAWKKGEEIDVREYIKFIKDYSALFTSYVCLDSIPGSLGQMDRSQAEIEKSAAASYRNQQIMRDAGLSPIPVFHQGERYEWLERMLSDGEEYIGLSPYLRSPQDEIIRWLDNCFSMLVDSRGEPSVKTHGFGATGARLVARYPWRSADSTTWAITSSYGIIKVPELRSDGELDYLAKPLLVYTGYGSKPADYAATWSLDGMSSHGLARVEAFADACGLSLLELHNSQYARTAAQVFYLREMERQRLERGPTFSSVPSFCRRSTPVPLGAVPFEFKLVFATLITMGYQATILTKSDVRNRLLSYFELRRHGDKLEEYVSKGYMGTARNTKLPPPARQQWRKEHYKDFRRRAVAARGDGVSDEQEAPTRRPGDGQARPGG